MKRKVVFNTAVQLIGKTINTLSSLTITFLIGRRLGVSFYGDFTKVISTTALLYMVLDFGLNATVVKQITHKPRSIKTQFQNLLAIRLISAAVLFLSLNLIMLIIPTPTNQGYTASVKLSLLLFSLSYFFQAVFLTSNSIFQKKLNYLKSVISGSVGSLTQLALVIRLLSLNPTLIQIVTAHFFGSLTMAGLSLYFVNSYTGSIFPKLNIKLSKKIICATAPIGLALIFNLLSNHLDTIILTLFRPTQEVGIYGLGRRIFEVALVFPTFFMNAAYPIFLIKRQHSPATLKQAFSKSFIALLLFGIITAISLYLLAPLTGLIKTEFSASVWVLRIFALVTPVFFITSLLLWTLVVQSQQHQLAKTYFIALIINLTLNLILVPQYGYIVPAFSAAITEVFVLALLLPKVLQSFRLNEPDNQ